MTSCNRITNAACTVIGWPGRPEGRPGRAATRGSTIRDPNPSDSPDARNLADGNRLCNCDRMAQPLVAARPGRTNLSVGARARGRATRFVDQVWTTSKAGTQSI